MSLFPVLPDTLADLAADALDALAADIRTKMASVLAAMQPGSSDEAREVLGDLSAEQIVTQYQEAAVALAAVEAEVNARTAGVEAAFQTLLEQAPDSVKALAADDDEDDDAEEPEALAADDTEAEAVEPEVVEPVEEAVVASVTPLRRPPSPSRSRQPIVQEPTGAALVASAGVGGGIESGSRLGNRIAVAEALMAARGNLMAAPAGFSDKAVVASAKFSLPESRRLYGDAGDTAKVQAVVGPEALGFKPGTEEEALVASGGLCAPVNNYYDLANISSPARPVRDALVGFQATRGGINVAAVPTLADVTTGVGYKTQEQDAGGGTLPNKTCQVVSCPSFSEVDVQMVYHCLQFGNLQARTFPEQVAQFTDLTMAAHARLAEGLLLDGIGSASTAVTSAAVNGAVNSLLGVILQTAAGMRSRHRTVAGMTLRALFPEWVKDLLVLDLIRGQFDRFERNQNGVSALLRSFGIEASFYLDSATGASQVFGAQSPGAFLEFPDTVVWYLYPEGSFLFLDNGSLELGIVRDSTLNETNDFTIFGETFENVAFVGVESLKVTSTVCPNGAVAAPGTATSC